MLNCEDLEFSLKGVSITNFDVSPYCSLFPVFLKPPVGGEPGARSLPSLLAALIIIVILLFCAFGTSKFWSQFTRFPIVSAEESYRHLGWHEGDTFYFGVAYCFNVFLFYYCELDYLDVGFIHQKHIQILLF